MGIKTINGWLVSYLSNKNTRTKQRNLQILYSFVFKGVTISLSFVVLSATFIRLDSESYGIWLTINSLASMISFMDIGIGNGLRNKLTAAISLKNEMAAKEFVSTGYISMLILSLSLLLIVNIVSQNINWEQFFNTGKISNQDLGISIFHILGTIVINFTFNLSSSIFQALQQNSRAALLLILTNIIFLGILYTNEDELMQLNLSSVSYYYLISNISSGIIVTSLLFIKNYNITPLPKYFRLNRLKEISGIGIKFFILQLSPIILIYSDNVIVSKYLGPSEVAIFGTTQRLFLGIWTLVWLLLNSLTSFVIDAYVKNDLHWIRLTVINTIKRTIALGTILTIALSVLFPYITKIWLGQSISPQATTLMLFSIFIIVNVWNYIFQYTLQGLNQLNELLVASFCSILIKIVLSTYLVRTLNFGSDGVILSSILAMIPLAIIGPIICFRRLTIK